jgi:hypothetical protein
MIVDQPAVKGLPEGQVPGYMSSPELQFPGDATGIFEAAFDISQSLKRLGLLSRYIKAGGVLIRAGNG